MEIKKYSEDMTEEESKSLANYISNGCPGLVKIDDSKVFKWFELYMSGKNYSEISQITKDKKDLIMYISYKSKWHDKRLEYYNDVSSGLFNKIKSAKIDSANTVVNIISALNKYYNDKFNNYVMSNNKEIIENLDVKILEKYYKSLEILDKIISPTKEDKNNNSATVNVNLNGNTTIQQKDENTIEISSSKEDAAAGNLLKALAEYQKSKEK